MAYWISRGKTNAYIQRIEMRKLNCLCLFEEVWRRNIWCNFSIFSIEWEFPNKLFLEIFPLVTSKLQVIKSLLRAHFLFNQQTTHKVKLGGPEKIYVFTFKCFIIFRLAKLDNLNIQERILIIQISETRRIHILFYYYEYRDFDCNSR